MRLCPWSRAFLTLASRGSVQGFEPCVLDSTSGLDSPMHIFGGPDPPDPSRIEAPVREVPNITCDVIYHVYMQSIQKFIRYIFLCFYFTLLVFALFFISDKETKDKLD